MKLFWLNFKEDARGMLFRLGCGISAADIDDVWRIIKEHQVLSSMSQDVVSIREISFADIDVNHVLPNSGNYAVRGLWFPIGI